MINKKLFKSLLAVLLSSSIANASSLTTEVNSSNLKSNWWQNAIGYEVYIRSFSDSTGNDW